MVKAVQDMGDRFKDDTFRKYGAELSALWVMEFACRYALTSEITTTPSAFFFSDKQFVYFIIVSCKKKND